VLNNNLSLLFFIGWKDEVCCDKEITVSIGFCAFTVLLMLVGCQERHPTMKKFAPTVLAHGDR